MASKFASPARLGLLLLTGLLYLSYVVFVIHQGRGPVDYETFMGIGQHLLNGAEVYSENSYYPMPYVIIFALFSLLPRPLSLALWLLLPVLTILVICDWEPFALLFAPTFGHFVGGQSAIFGMLGLWGFRRNLNLNRAVGGIWLGLTLLKPQLGLVPCLWAAAQWWRSIRADRHIPRQALAFVATFMALFLPSFLVAPDWPLRWLGHARPLFQRALSGIVPRTILLVVPPQSLGFWVILVAVGGALLWAVWLLCQRQPSLDILVLWGFVVSPLVHDYDLIQLLPLLETRVLQWAGVLLSLPGWWVIFMAYRNDVAWYAFTIIAPGLLWISLKYRAEFLRAGRVDN